MHKGAVLSVSVRANTGRAPSPPEADEKVAAGTEDDMAACAKLSAELMADNLW